MSAPEQAVQEWLRHGPFGADPATARILKARSTEHRRVYALTFRDRHGGRWNWTLPVDAQPDGAWAVAGGSGGGGAPPLLAAYARLRTRLMRTGGRRPWANLGGGNWPDRFYAGGRVESDRERTAVVRLTSANGLVLSDTVEAGHVLFLTEERVEMPVVVELLAADGSVLALHTAFDVHRWPDAAP